MISALLLGSVAALMWGSASIISAPPARLVGPWVAMLWMSLAATVVAIMLALPTGPPSASASDWALVAVAGAGFTSAAGFWFLAVSGGQVSVITPIVACDGALAAVLAALTGATLSTFSAAALAVMVGGIVLVAAGSAAAPGGGAQVLRFSVSAGRPVAQTAVLSVMSAISFAGVFYASGKVEDMDPTWVVAFSLLIPAGFAFALCWGTGRLELPSGTWRWILPFGVVESVGYVAYVVGSREDLAIAAVAASQYAAVAVIGGVLAFGEALSRSQLFGVALLIASQSAIAAQAI